MNYIFSGLGHAVGAYKITNNQIAESVKSGDLSGFNEQRVLNSKNYLKIKEQYPDLTPFDYFAFHKMGFKNRYHVAPFPPTKNDSNRVQNSLDLAVQAVGNAIEDASVSPDEIDAWYVSTVSAPEIAPGIASTLKCYFANIDNQSLTTSLASGCSGFNLNLQRAVEYFRYNPKAKHIVIVHTEVMSSFLKERKSFVPYVTFGDAAGAVVISRTDNNLPGGLIDIVNFQDMRMIDFVGVDSDANLYMDDMVVKNRAVVNLENASRKVLDKSKMSVDNIDLVIPHQTGNAILHEFAANVNLSINKLYQEGQHEFGNVSGATVLLSLSLLKQQDKLVPGMRILSATAGVGGKYGAFTYIIPDYEIEKKKYIRQNDLTSQSVTVTGENKDIVNALSSEVLKRNGELKTLGSKSDYLVYIASDDFNQNIKYIQEQYRNHEKSIVFVSSQDNRSAEFAFFATLAPELYSKGIRFIYYHIPQFNNESDIKKIVNSLYVPKGKNTRDSYFNTLIYREENL